jgi:hypothetical protein
VTTLALVAVLLTTTALAVETEPDWSNRLQALKQDAITNFKAPKIGQQKKGSEPAGPAYRARRVQTGRHVR